MLILTTEMAVKRLLIILILPSSMMLGVSCSWLLLMLPRFVIALSLVLVSTCDRAMVVRSTLRDCCTINVGDIAVRLHWNGMTIDSSLPFQEVLLFLLPLSLLIY